MNANVGSTADAGIAGDDRDTYRLTIRIKIQQGPAPSPSRQFFRTRKPAAIAATVAALLGLGWLGFNALQTDAPAATADRASTAANEPSQNPVTESTTAAPVTIAPTLAATAPPKARSESAARPAAPTTSIDEVLPEPSRGALNTIRGTIRVAIRVAIDPQGAVSAATAHERGPSRYFERLSLEAARKWTFTPGTEPREMLLRFNFTRDGVTAATESV